MTGVTNHTGLLMSGLSMASKAGEFSLKCAEPVRMQIPGPWAQRS